MRSWVRLFRATHFKCQTEAIFSHELWIFLVSHKGRDRIGSSKCAVNTNKANDIPRYPMELIYCHSPCDWVWVARRPLFFRDEYRSIYCLTSDINTGRDTEFRTFCLVCLGSGVLLRLCFIKCVAAKSEGSEFGVPPGVNVQIWSSRICIQRILI